MKKRRHGPEVEEKWEMVASRARGAEKLPLSKLNAAKRDKARRRTEDISASNFKGRESIASEEERGGEERQW